MHVALVRAPVLLVPMEIGRVRAPILSIVAQIANVSPAIVEIRKGRSASSGGSRARP